MIIKPSEAELIEMESRALELVNLDCRYHEPVVFDAGRDLLRLVALVRSSSSSH